MNGPSDGGSNNNTQNVTVGQNIVVAINTLNNTINTRFPNWVTAPANSTASGVAGQVAFSGSATASSYFYLCLVGGAAGSATWGRTLLTTGF